jgi:REP element-mobilizing transposase RayT
MSGYAIMSPMPVPTPLYTPENCRPAYQLNWSLTVFWTHPAEFAAWLDDLKRATEPDGVRILEHRFCTPGVSQFFLSTLPGVAPPQLVRSVKGRLQYLVRNQYPTPFRRHYALRSVGTADRQTIEDYVRTQTEHHLMADPRVQNMLERQQIQSADADLCQARRTAHGQFWYNLHLVFVHERRWREFREEGLAGTREMILAAARKHGHLLSAAGIVPDHIHVTLGCNWDESPESVAICYMNNLAYNAGMKPIFKYGYYAGTIGEYDLGAMRQ